MKCLVIYQRTLIGNICIKCNRYLWLDIKWKLVYFLTIRIDQCYKHFLMGQINNAQKAGNLYAYNRFITLFQVDNDIRNLSFIMLYSNYTKNKFLDNFNTFKDISHRNKTKTKRWHVHGNKKCIKRMWHFLRRNNLIRY